jgi:hypothetical protein
MTFRTIPRLGTACGATIGGSMAVRSGAGIWARLVPWNAAITPDGALALVNLNPAVETGPDTRMSSKTAH